MKKTIILSILALTFLFSCIEEYNPEIDIKDTELFVIEGEVTDMEGFQSIYVSKSSEIDNPERIPISNCDVKIYDDKGNIFQSAEYEYGEYKAYIDQNYLSMGTAFKIEITMPDGQIIRSEYDTLRNCPEIDSLYYIIEEFPSPDPDKKIPGIQFYIDYDGGNSKTKKVKFEVEETWKYKTEYPIKWIWQRYWLTEINPPDYSKQICWKTQQYNDFFILSTDNLNDNKYLQFPLHNILNTSEKLLNGYSLLIRQYAISEHAFQYYKKINSNIIDEGGLYESQPQQLTGNLTNISNPEKRVLGYFSVTGIKTKRIFIDYVDELPLNPSPTCEPIILDLGYRMLRGVDKPVYLWLEDEVLKLSDACVDCTSVGGTTEKPNFWPN